MTPQPNSPQHAPAAAPVSGAPAADSPTAGSVPPAPRRSPLVIVVDLLRGFLMGLVETIPGVSGATVALITGIYARLIRSGKLITDMIKGLITRGDWRTPARQIEWGMLIAVGVGMVVAVFSIAGTMKSFVEDSPVTALSLFGGMIAASVFIPVHELKVEGLVHRGNALKLTLVALVAAGVMVGITSLPTSTEAAPPLWLVYVAAAVAVCALVLPGASGSFFLLVIGIYAPTMDAVDQRDLTYIGVFVLGALTGAVLFVRVVEWLLENHRTLTLVAMTGLLLGSLRALWPWATESNGLLAPGDDWPRAVGFFLLGIVIVGGVFLLQVRLQSRAKKLQELPVDLR